MGMARLRPLGWAGMDGGGQPEPLDYYGNPYNGYAHLGLELWTKYPDFSNDPKESASHELAQALLTGIARIALDRQAAKQEEHA